MTEIGLSFWLLLILLSLIALFIGYRIGKGATPKTDPQQLGKLKASHASLQKEYDTCKARVAELESRQSLVAESFDPAMARAAMGKKVHENDLKLIEGIGPKIESLFHNFDIRTWKDLATCKVEKCREVLQSGGDRFRVHDPSSWPLQAKMACQGDWKGLARWQEEHKHGRL